MEKLFKGLIGLILLTFVLSFSLIGCGSGGGDNGGGGGVGIPKSLSGVAAKGPIIGGTVTVFVLNPDGSKGGLLSTAITGPDGLYSADIGTYTGNVIVEVTGGTYKDEATGNIIPNPLTLRAALTGVSDTVNVAVTPLTEIAVQTATNKAGGLNTTNIDNGALVKKCVNTVQAASLPCSFESLIPSLYSIPS